MFRVSYRCATPFSRSPLPHRVWSHRAGSTSAVKERPALRYWSRDETERLRAAIADGKTASDCALLFEDRTKEAVKNKFRRLIPAKRFSQVPQKQQVERVVALARDGQSRDNIAKMVSEYTCWHISAILRTYGVPHSTAQRRSRVNWTAQDLATVRDALRTGETAMELTKKLPDRSLAAIEIKMKSPERPYTRENWTSIKDHELLSLSALGFKQIDIATRLKRSRGSIEARLRKLRRKLEGQGQRQEFSNALSQRSETDGRKANVTVCPRPLVHTLVTTEPYRTNGLQVESSHHTQASPGTRGFGIHPGQVQGYTSSTSKRFFTSSVAGSVAGSACRISLQRKAMPLFEAHSRALTLATLPKEPVRHRFVKFWSAQETRKLAAAIKEGKPIVACFELFPDRSEKSVRLKYTRVAFGNVSRHPRTESTQLIIECARRGKTRQEIKALLPQYTALKISRDLRDYGIVTPQHRQKVTPRWSAEEIEVFSQGLQDGITAIELARKLQGRTLAAIESRIFRYSRLPTRALSRGKRIWTVSHEDELIHLAVAGLRHADIAARIGRSEQAVSTHLSRLRDGGDPRLEEVSARTGTISRQHSILPATFRDAYTSGVAKQSDSRIRNMREQRRRYCTLAQPRQHYTSALLARFRAYHADGIRPITARPRWSSMDTEKLRAVIAKGASAAECLEIFPDRSSKAILGKYRRTDPATHYKLPRSKLTVEVLDLAKQGLTRTDIRSRTGCRSSLFADLSARYAVSVPQTVPSRGHFWSGREDHLLSEGVANGTLAKDMMPHLPGRTVVSIEMRIRRLRNANRAGKDLSGRASKRGQLWTKADDDEMLRLQAAGLPEWEIAAALGRSQRAVNSRSAIVRKLRGLW
jgi:DNA-binding NarL/FixJ family response regulator